MPWDSGENRSKATPAEQEVLPCPRCDSTNTKFCYYNNYNFSQPRHFCKSCRRYWTHGGTLRDIPVGGATRKNAKRSRTSSSSPLPPTLPLSANHCSAGSFTSLLNTQGPGFLALTGLGLDDMGFGLFPFPGVGGSTGLNLMGNTWQFESGEGGFVGGD